MKRYEQIEYLQSQGMTWEDIAKQLGSKVVTLQRNFHSKRSLIKAEQDLADLKEIGMSPDNVADFNKIATEVLFHDTKQPEDIDWRELISYAQAGQQINQRLDYTNRIANVTVETDYPIAVMCTADWHLGDNYTDHTAWSRDIQFLIDEPLLKAILLGDETQNMRSFRNLSVILQQVLTPPQQVQLFKSVINELTTKKKLLAKVLGNHDAEFDERIFGEPLMKYLLDKKDMPKFPNRGLLKLTVGEQLYTFLLVHESRYNSFLRACHANYREYQLSFPADIVATAHTHAPSIEQNFAYTLAREAGFPFGGEAIFFKAGSYQDNEYSWKYFQNTLICNPTVVLYPDRHKKVVFADPRDAVEFAKIAK